MGIVRAVTAVAVLRDLLLEIVVVVAGRTAYPVMHAKEIVAGLLQVIVFRRLPFLGDMAFYAVCATCTSMFIVCRVATIAALRSLRVATADVAGVAGQRGMRPGQLKVRGVVIKFPATPRRRAVALPTGLRKLAPMHIVGLVASDTGVRRLAPRLTLRVAGRAIERRVRAIERKIGILVRKFQAVEPINIGIAPLVFGVAAATLTCARIAHAAVIPVVLSDIRRDVLVASEAQRALRAHVGAVVAVCTVLLLFYVGPSHWPWHQQCFNRCTNGGRYG